MKYNLPDRVFRELSALAVNIQLQKSFCSVPVQEEQIPKEVILT